MTSPAKSGSRDRTRATIRSRKWYARVPSFLGGTPRSFRRLTFPARSGMLVSRRFSPRSRGLLFPAEGDMLVSRAFWRRSGLAFSSGSWYARVPGFSAPPKKGVGAFSGFVSPVDGRTSYPAKHFSIKALRSVAPGGIKSAD